MKNPLSKLKLIPLIGLMGALGGCFKDTRTGNPDSVKIVSRPWNTSALSSRQSGLIARPQATVDFQFCVTQLKWTLQSGGSDLSNEIRIGLIDVSNSAVSTTWAEIDPPADNSYISEVNVELHQDPETCDGVGYSLSYRGVELTKDLEFKFSFSAPLPVDAGDEIHLVFGAIQQALESAYQAGKLNNEEIGSYLEATTKGDAAIR